ncbi:MAG: hypothetical protein ACJ77Z_17530 [Thermoleophilaceae bacterium]
MSTAPARKGQLVQYETPNWDPLMNTVGHRVIGDFMWMHEVKLTDGRCVHAFKHVDTRRYIHLDEDGNAFVYTESGRYKPMPAARVLAAVFMPLTPDLIGVTPGQIAVSWEAVDRLDAADTQVEPEPTS